LEESWLRRASRTSIRLISDSTRARMLAGVFSQSSSVISIPSGKKRSSTTAAPPEVFLQGVEKNRFDRTGTLIVTVVFAPALCIACMHPVGRPVAGAGKPIIDKGLGENDRISVKLVPIIGKHADVFGKKPGSQVFDPYPWQDQEAEPLQAALFTFNQFWIRDENQYCYSHV